MSFGHWMETQEETKIILLALLHGFVCVCVYIYIYTLHVCVLEPRACAAPESCVRRRGWAWPVPPLLVQQRGFDLDWNGCWTKRWELRRRKWNQPRTQDFLSASGWGRRRSYRTSSSAAVGDIQGPIGWCRALGKGGDRESVDGRGRACVE